MTWQPTEGMKRANQLLIGIEADVAMAGLAPMARAVLFNRLAQALDEALAEWPVDEAGLYLRPPTAAEIATTSTNPHAAIVSGTYTNGNGHDPDDYSELPAWMGDEAVAAAEEGPRELVGMGLAQLKQEGTELRAAWADPPEVVEAMKKKRGRPPGSKGKKAKAKRKSAKAIKADTVAAEQTGWNGDLVGETPAIEAAPAAAEAIAEQPL